MAVSIKQLNPTYGFDHRSDFLCDALARERPRLPCVKGAVKNLLIFDWGIVAAVRFRRSSYLCVRTYRTIPPSRLRRATSLYTREALVRCKTADRTIHPKVYRSALFIHSTN